MITLHCDRQTLIRTDSESVSAGGFGFIRFSYTADESWEGYSVSAQFHRLGEKEAFHVAGIVQGVSYPLPSEVIAKCGIFTVCLFGVKGQSYRATSNVVTVEVGENGLVDAVLPTPTPDIFNQYVSSVLTAAANAAQAARAAEESAADARNAEAFIHSVFVEEEFAAQVADWNASFQTDVKNAKASVENQRKAAEASLWTACDEALATLDEKSSEAQDAYRAMHISARQEYALEADSKREALESAYADMLTAGEEAYAFQERLNALENADCSEKWELISEDTLSEEVGQVRKDFDRYYKKLLIEMMITADTTAYTSTGGFALSNSEVSPDLYGQIYRTNYFLPCCATVKKVVMKIEIVQGACIMQTAWDSAWESSIENVSNILSPSFSTYTTRANRGIEIHGGMRKANITALNHITISNLTTKHPIPSGTTIKIYGVKA